MQNKGRIPLFEPAANLVENGGRLAWACRKQVESQLRICFKPGDFSSHVCDMT